jgi:hypothetical protein
VVDALNPLSDDVTGNDTAVFGTATPAVLEPKDGVVPYSIDRVPGSK